MARRKRDGWSWDGRRAAWVWDLGMLSRTRIHGCSLAGPIRYYGPGKGWKVGRWSVTERVGLKAILRTLVATMPRRAWTGHLGRGRKGAVSRVSTSDRDIVSVANFILAHGLHPPKRYIARKTLFAWQAWERQYTDHPGVAWMREQGKLLMQYSGVAVDIRAYGGTQKEPAFLFTGVYRLLGALRRTALSSLLRRLRRWEEEQEEKISLKYAGAYVRWQVGTERTLVCAL